MDINNTKSELDKINDRIGELLHTKPKTQAALDARDKELGELEAKKAEIAFWTEYDLKITIPERIRELEGVLTNVC